VTLHNKSRWKKMSAYAGLALEIGFSLAYLLSLLRLVKRAATTICAPVREECDKYDMTAGPCF
jgi:hypothetical protein